MIHILKTHDEFMIDIATGRKSFEFRVNDRDYGEGDILILQGFDTENKKYTSKCIEAEVIYILHCGFSGIKEDYCIMGIKVRNYNF